VTLADLVEYGFQPEFIARFGKVVVLDAITPDCLKRIVRMESSVVAALKREFADQGIILEITEDGLDQLAQEAANLNLGARGLRKVVENRFGDLLPHLEELLGVQRVVVNARTLRGEEGPFLIKGPALVKARSVQPTQADHGGLTPQLKKLFPPGSLPKRPA